MFKKHWKKILLSLCSMLWSGCSDDSSSESKDLIACDLEQICPEYGIFYDCENEEDAIAGNFENCTMSYPACTDTYYCEDDVTCFQSTDDETKTFDCRDEKDKKTLYSEDEFKSKYYVDGQLIH